MFIGWGCSYLSEESTTAVIYYKLIANIELRLSISTLFRFQCPFWEEEQQTSNAEH